MRHALSPLQPEMHTQSSRILITFVTFVLCVFTMTGQTSHIVIADSARHATLPGASIFDCNGNLTGITNTKGRSPRLPASAYPITVRYLGYKETTVANAENDTVFMQESFTHLPEVVIESRQHKVLHILAYVREYSTLSTYSDTVFLFREKIVDFMYATGKESKFKGWSNPRILNSKSYFRFTNSNGLDSVSDKCGNHFSWSDWIGIPPVHEIPKGLKNKESATDTVFGKYSPTEIWHRNNSRVNTYINVLADTTSRKWVPNLSAFFKKHLDFEHFKIRFNFDNVAGNTITPMDLAGYTFNIESNGRGIEMFQFNRSNEPFFVSTYAEVYILDKEFITVKEAKKWKRRKFDSDNIDIYEPAEAPELQPHITQLIARVNSINSDKVRTSKIPDHRLIGRKTVKQHFGQRLLQLFKTVTGISRHKMNSKINKQWSDFREEQFNRNKNNPTDTDE